MSLADDCLAGKHRSKFTITGSMVIKYSRSPFLVWCDLFAPPEQRDPISRYLHLLFDRGIEHEKQVVSRMFPEAVPLKIKTLESGFRQVVEECKKGTSVLAGAPLFFLTEDIHGVIDVLCRSDEHSSVFGNYHYRVKEIKSAKHIKKEYIMQAALYNYLIGKVQGYTPPVFYLINRENQEYEFEFSKYENELMGIIEGIRHIMSGEKVSPTAKGLRWPWESYGIKKAIEAHDVSIIPNVGPSLKKKLNLNNIFTAEDLAAADNPGDILDSTWTKIKRYAQAWVSKKAIPIKKPSFKSSEVEIFLDFEGTDEYQTEEGMVKADYLIGVLLSEGKSEKYIPFVAKDLSQEEDILKDFFEFMKGYENVPVYHYGSYEKFHLKELGKKYNLDFSNVIKNMVDVLPVLKKSVALPTISMSLKDVAKFLGFSWRDMASAQESIVLYFRYLETKDETILQKILDYNEDDVKATKVVKDYLAELD